MNCSAAILTEWWRNDPDRLLQAALAQAERLAEMARIICCTSLSERVLQHGDTERSRFDILARLHQRTRPNVLLQLKCPL